MTNSLDLIFDHLIVSGATVIIIIDIMTFYMNIQCTPHLKLHLVKVLLAPVSAYRHLLLSLIRLLNLSLGIFNHFSWAEFFQIIQIWWLQFMMRNFQFLLQMFDWILGQMIKKAIQLPSFLFFLNYSQMIFKVHFRKLSWGINLLPILSFIPWFFHFIYYQS